MSLPLPVLDDRRFSDLVAEAQSLIPAYQPSWTDYNASDPGMTLIELFAWLAEMLIYRADQVPETHVRAFLNLLDPNAQSTGDLEADVTATVAALRTEYRAVTAADYETHARAIDGVARARCVPLRDLSPAFEADRLLPAPGQVSMIIVPDQHVSDPSTVTSAVAADLVPRRLITTRVSVVDPIFTPIAVHLLLATPADLPPANVPTPVDSACGTLLNRVNGGSAGTGWPFGRPVYVGDLIAAVEALREVDHVVDIDLTSTGSAATARWVDGTELLADDGLLIGIALGQEALPQLARPVDVATSATFVPITAQVNATLAPDVGPSAEPGVLAAIIRTVRDLAWPGRGWPATGEGTGGTLDSGRIDGAVAAINGVGSVQSVTLTADPIAAPGRVTTSTNNIMSVTTGTLELIDLTVNVSLT